MEGSRVQNWIHHLHVLASARPTTFSCIISECDKDLLVAIAEIFVNIGNLTFEISDIDLRVFERHIDSVEELGGLITKTRLNPSRDIVEENRPIVQRGIKAALLVL